MRSRKKEGEVAPNVVALKMVAPDAVPCGGPGGGGGVGGQETYHILEKDISPYQILFQRKQCKDRAHRCNICKHSHHRNESDAWYPFVYQKDFLLFPLIDLTLPLLHPWRFE